MSSTWPTVQLGELCDVQIGKTPTRATARYWGDGHPWLTISDMNQGRDIWATSESITDAAITELNCRLVPPETVLLSFKLSIGKVSIARIPLYTNEAVAHLPIVDARLDRDFLYWALRTTRLTDAADRAAKGATLNTAKLRKIPIPLPPMAEQQRIAAVLDAADALLAMRRRAMDAVGSLPGALFRRMFVEAQDSWDTANIETLAAQRRDAIRTGPFGSQLLHEEFTDSGIAVLGIDNAVGNRFAWGRRRFISEAKYRQLRRYTVRPGDVLVTIMGTCGRVAVVPDDIPTAINTKHLCCISLDRDRCLPEFLWGCLRFHPQVLRQLGATQGAVMPGLNMGLIKRAEVPVPPIELQAEFVEEMASIRHQEDLMQRSATQLDVLFNAVRYRVFEGAA